MNDEIPEGLHVMQYGLHLLEFTLGWPAKNNQELMADCLTSIVKAKRLSEVQAYRYMLRAIGLAKDQGIAIDRIWFMNGEYANVRPVAKPTYGYGCNPECKSRHGKGYHLNDIQWLLIRYERMKDSLPNRPMTDAEIDKLLAELDSKRQGGAPQWRRSGA
jgi:hypothetical protein